MPDTKCAFAPRLRRRLLLTLPLLFSALFVSLATLTTFAHDFSPDRIAAGDLVDVQVKVDGSAAPLFLTSGRPDRHYFQAFRGRNYSLVIHNRTGGRVGVLIAVDGLNVVSGDRSRLSGGEAMYVLDPYEQAEIRGWRTSLDDVRRFVFVDEEKSYAERSDKANADMGWVRVLAFQEHGRLWRKGIEGSMRDQQPGAPYEREDRNERKRSASEGSGDRGRKAMEAPLSADGEMGSRQESNPGTGWGRKSHDPVRRTAFNAESQATDHHVLRYEYASGLLALGIDLHPRRHRLQEREHGDFGFAQPPKR